MSYTKLLNYRKVYYISFLLLIIYVACSQAQTNYELLDKSIRTTICERQIPGLSACIVKGNKLQWSKAYGWADITNKVSMSTNTIMNIASISKTVTATTIMQLWEKGKVKLDVDINEYLPFNVRNPHFPDVPITIWNLLTHTSSINDGSAYSESYSCGDPNISLKYWIANYLTNEGEFYNEKENFHSWKPGENSYYSNVGFGLLGYIVEEVSSLPFNLYCKKHIFDPLQMNNSGWFLSEIDTTNHAVPYTYINLLKNGDTKPLYNNVSLCLYSFPNYPDGLLRTSVEDLSHYLVAFINGGAYKNKQILESSTIDKMLSLQIAGNVSQGLCWSRSDFESLWGHGGADPGVGTRLFFNPDTKISVIVFINSDNGDSFDIAKQLYSQAID